MLPIESNVPMPDPSYVVPTSIYPFRTMEVGDCFTASIEKRKSVNAIARRHQRKGIGKFKIRVSENRQFIRCWRVE